MGHSRQLDYETYTKRGVILAVSMFVVGAIGASVEYNLNGSLPGWESMLFSACLAGGVVLGLVSVFGFGILLPLTD